MDISNYEGLIAALERENRILKKKLMRSETNRLLLEEALETHSFALKVRNFELEQSQDLIRQSEARYRDLAFHDLLTGLPNRVYFHEQLNRAIIQSKQHQALIALFFIDLDRFKPINDRLGHDIGDKLLHETGCRLRTCARNRDTVARIGGDEFAILSEDLQEAENARLMAQRILNAFNIPFILAGKPYKISASIGISLYPSDGENSESLLQNADNAMYFIKKSGRNNYKFFQDLVRKSRRTPYPKISTK